MWLIICAAFLAAGCVYERRSTTLHAVSKPSKDLLAKKPAHVWAFRVLAAEIPARRKTGLGWDEDGTGPDPFVRIYTDKRLVWESPHKENQTSPKWNTTLPRNLLVRPDTQFRVEIWDRDTVVTSDPIGQRQYLGLPPNARPEAVARLLFEGGVVLTVSVTEPRVHRGVGITDFEVRSDGLHVVTVETYSPAGRAGIRVGERVVTIDGLPVDSLPGGKAATMLSLAAERSYPLEVVDLTGSKRNVNLDQSYVWLIM